MTYHSVYNVQPVFTHLCVVISNQHHDSCMLWFYMIVARPPSTLSDKEALEFIFHFGFLCLQAICVFNLVVALSIKLAKARFLYQETPAIHFITISNLCHEMMVK